ncbi:MAG: nicotinate-nucleotide adenylyltransferase [Chloroflexota bacterium]
MTRLRLGLFGGTFDPPHLGHLILASEACAQLRLDRLLWVLTPTPPHKLGQAITPAEQRLALVERAIAGDPLFELSRVELDRPGPHYTLDTLRQVQADHPQADVILLIGGDSLRDLPTWRQAADLLAACREIGVMRRPGDSADLSALEESLPGLRSKLRFVDAPLLEIASSEIRRRAAQGEPFRYYVPAAVHDYIQRHRLYQPADPGMKSSS